MMGRKYTDEEVIKALECCANADCLNCPRWSEEWTSGMCADFLPSVLDLINRQRAEIAALVSAVDNSTKEFLKLHDDYQDQKAEIERLQWGEYRHIGKTVLNARNEGIEEFAERLKEKMNNLSRMEYHCDPYFLVSKDFIDKTAKELTEGKPCTDGADCFAAEGKE